METVNTMQSYFEPSGESRLLYVVEQLGSEDLKVPSVIGWYRILRSHYEWPLFQAIRYALWLAR